MVNVQHASLTGDEVHEPRRIETASSGEVYVADGSNSGAWGLAETIEATKSLGSSGYVKLPGGLIMQWGVITAFYANTYSVSFPIAFPTSCFGVTGSFQNTHNVGSDNNTYAISLFNKTNSGFTLIHGGSTGSNMNIFWIALGY